MLMLLKQVNLSFVFHAASSSSWIIDPSATDHMAGSLISLPPLVLFSKSY